MRKTHILSFLMLAAMAGICACSPKVDPEPTPSVPQEELDRLYTVNMFGYNVMNTFYLWNEEVSDSLATWKLNEDPVEKVRRTRYKDANGKDIDKWTTLTDNIESMISKTGGVSTTYGFDFKLYYTDNTQTGVCMVVTLVYPGSPAEKAGFKRGDVFLKIAGTSLNVNNYQSLLYDKFLYAPDCILSDLDGKDHSMTAVEMYENPVLVSKVFDVGDKKVGYLLFNRFTLGACRDLVEAGKYFRKEGIDDLILDMRYNSGGYVITETLLASMLAPEDEVIAGSVFETSVYNKVLTGGDWDKPTCFAEDFTVSDSEGTHTVSVAGANPGIKHLYAIMTEDSASASESILVGLMPYLDVRIFGQKSGGKYCTGIMYSAKDWFEDYDDQLKDNQRELGKKYADKWGIYVMIARFADKLGNTPCMPDGFEPDYYVEDNPTEPYPLGDEREAMLAAVLAHLGGKTLPAPGKAAARAPGLQPQPLGARIPLERDPLYSSRILLK